MTPRQAASKVKSLPPEDVTVELWLRSWTIFFPRKRTAETDEHDTYMLEPFIRRHGPKPLSAITPLMAQQWALKHPHQVKYLRLAWQKAVLMRIAPFNVWKVVELPPRMSPPRVPPTVEQLDAALACARAKGGWWLWFADMVEATAFTGARQGGMCGLRAAHVDLDGRRMELTEKGGKTRRVVLTGRSLDAMRRALARPRPVPWQRTTLVFPGKKGGRLSRRPVSEAWCAIRGDFPGPFHTLKHFGGTWLAAHGVDERDIAIQLGHTDAQGRPYTDLVRSVYVHPNHDDALDRIEAMMDEAGRKFRALDEQLTDPLPHRGELEERNELVGRLRQATERKDSK